MGIVATSETTSVSYSYDADSNRLTADGVAFTYNPDDTLASETKSDGTRSFGYDAAGNLTSSAASFNANTAYTYDAANHLLSTTAPGQPAVTNTLDALGRRRTRNDGTTTATYSYIGTGDTVSRVVTGATTLDSVIDAMGDRLTVGSLWTLPNLRGDVAGLLSASATSVSDAYRYDPYGLSLGASGSDTNPWRFGGRLLEPVSGQYDFGARQYDPALAAFTSLDTVLGSAQNPLSLNRYLYTWANPESMVDPDGHSPAPKYGESTAASSRITSLLDQAKAARKAAGKLKQEADAAQRKWKSTQNTAGYWARQASEALRLATNLADSARRIADREDRAPVEAAAKAARADYASKRSIANSWAGWASADYNAWRATYTAWQSANGRAAALEVQAAAAQAAAKAKAAAVTYGGKRSSGDGGLSDTVHTVLGVASVVPVIGGVANLADAGLYGTQGDFVMAGIALAGVVPILGDAADAARIGTRAAKVATEVAGDALKLTGKTAEVYEAGKGLTGAAKVAAMDAKARELYPKLAGMADQAHHIDPKYIGGAANGATATISAPYHQVITNAFRSIRSYGSGPVSPAEQQRLMDTVYAIFPY